MGVQKGGPLALPWPAKNSMFLDYFEKKNMFFGVFSQKECFCPSPGKKSADAHVKVCGRYMFTCVKRIYAFSKFFRIQHCFERISILHISNRIISLVYKDNPFTKTKNMPKKLPF
jgi:hypothetical protein